MSHDLEEVVTVVDGRPALTDELHGAPEELRTCFWIHPVTGFVRQLSVELPICRLAGPGCPRSRQVDAVSNTRQEWNLRALGSKPNGDAGNPRLVYWIRRQESDLRGLRSERSWDASNPHLNEWWASKELHLTSGLWRPVPRYEDRPKLAERGEPESHAASGTVCFPVSPRILPGSRSKLAEGGRSRSTHPEGATRFRSEGAPPRTSPSKVGRG